MRGRLFVGDKEGWGESVCIHVGPSCLSLCVLPSVDCRDEEGRGERFYHYSSSLFFCFSLEYTHIYLLLSTHDFCGVDDQIRGRRRKRQSLKTIEGREALDSLTCAKLAMLVVACCFLFLPVYLFFLFSVSSLFRLSFK